MPKIRLWVYLWLHFTFISTLLIILLMALFSLFSILFPSGRLTPRIEKDLDEAASLMAVLLESDIQGTSLDAFITRVLSQKRVEELNEEKVNGYALPWSAVGWFLSQRGQEGYELIVARSKDTAILAQREQALKRLMAQAYSTGETEKFFDRKYLIVAMPIYGTDDLHGALAYGTELPPITFKTALWFLRNTVPGMFFIFAIASFFTGGILAYVLSKRISGLRRVAEGFLEGRFGVQPIRTGKDELGLFAEVIAKLDSSFPAILEDRRRSGIWEERSRVAKRLHDTIKQDLFALSLMAEALERDAGSGGTGGNTAELASQIREGSVGALRTAMELIGAYTSERFKGSELESSIRAELERWRIAGAYKTYTLRIDTPILDDGTAEACFLIVKEGVTNAARHARARELRVELAEEGIELILTVGDDGYGFPRSWSPGSGILLMRERAKMLGAVLDLQSEPSKGTVLMVRFLRPKEL